MLTGGQSLTQYLPSDHAWLRWCVERAIFAWGNFVDSMLSQYTDKGKQKYALADLLKDRESEAIAPIVDYDESWPMYQD